MKEKDAKEIKEKTEKLRVQFLKYQDEFLKLMRSLMDLKMTIEKTIPYQKRPRNRTNNVWQKIIRDKRWKK